MKVICSHYKKCDTQICGHKIEHAYKRSCNQKCTTKYPYSKCVNVYDESIIDVDELFEEIDI